MDDDRESESDVRTAMKRRAGERAAADVPDGAVVGLGTGSTAAHAIDALGDRATAGDDLVGVPTSYQSRRRAIDAGVPVRDLDQVSGVDVAVDGADAVSLTGSESAATDASDDDAPTATGSVLVKGGGAAHAREKVVDAAADRLFVVVDPSKLTGDGPVSQPVPVEVLPVAAGEVVERVGWRGAEATVRAADRKDGPVVTDNGNWVLDCDFGAVADPADLSGWLSGLPGVVEHGLFVDLATRVYVGRPAGVDVVAVE